ncbi:MAG: hypothetical protein ACR2JY_02025 [Chloroflexota bacterium]
MQSGTPSAAPATGSDGRGTGSIVLAALGAVGLAVSGGISYVRRRRPAA